MKKTNNTSQAFWVILGSLSAFGLSIISAAILSRYFTKEEYGTYKQIIYVYNTFLFVFTAGLPKVYAYYLPRYSVEKGKDIVWKITKFLFLTGFLFSLFLYFSAPAISEALGNRELEKGLKIFAVVPILLLPTMGIEGIFSTYKQTIYIALYNTITRLLMLGAIILPILFWENNYVNAIYGWIVGSLFTLTIALILKNIPFRNITSEKAPIKIKEILFYSFPIAIASIWGIAIRAADQFYISRYFGADEFAVFSNGFIELPFVKMITTGTSVVLMPAFSKAIKDDENHENLVTVWKSALYKSAILIYPLVVFSIFYGKEIMILLYSDLYAGSGIYFQIHMALNLFNIIIFAPLLFALGKTKLYANVHLILAVTIWLMEYLVVEAFHSAVGIALLSVGLSILKIIIFFYFVSRYLNLKIIDLIPFPQILRIFIHAVLCSSLIKIFTLHQILEFSYLQLMISGCGYVLVVLLTGRIFKVDYFSIITPLFHKALHKYSKSN